VGTRSVFGDHVKTIKSEDDEEVTILDEFFRRNVNSLLGLGGSLLVFVSHGFLDELEVLAFLELGDMASNEPLVRVVTPTSHEEHEGLEDVGIELDDRVTFVEDVDSGFSDGVHLIRTKVGKGDLVGSFSIVGLNVEVGKSREEVTITADSLSLLSGLDELDSGLVNIVESDLVFVEAGGFIGNSFSFTLQGSNELREELEGFSLDGWLALGDVFRLESELLRVLNGFDPRVIDSFDVLLLREESTFGHDNDAFGSIIGFLEEEVAFKLVLAEREAL